MNIEEIIKQCEMWPNSAHARALKIAIEALRTIDAVYPAQMVDALHRITADREKDCPSVEAGAQSPDPTVNLVIAQMVERSKAGLEKYGATTAANPLTHAEWLAHAEEEMTDAAIYLRRARQTAEETERRLEMARKGLRAIADYHGTPHAIKLTAEHYLALSTQPDAKTG